MADKNNYLSRVTYHGGKDSYEFPFSYLRKNFVKAQIDLSESESNTLAYMVDYTIDGHTLNLTKPVDADKTITIYRETSSTPLVEYEDSSILRAYDLNLSQRQNLNILEEQTDIVGKNYSLTQNTKDYMYKNLMDTKTAIDNKMSETLDTVDSKLTTAQADVKKAVSDMNDSLDETKQFVTSSVSTMNDTVNTTKKSVEDSLAEMNTTVANTKKSVEESLATTTTNLNDAINTATSSMDNKITQTSQALEEAKATLETTKSDMEKALADTQSSLQDTENRVNETKADITKLANELKESHSSLQEDIKNISKTNRNMAYEVGDQIHSSYLPFNCYITCVTAGTTGDTLPVIPEGDHNSGFTYTDGTATFKMDYWPLSINGQKPLNKAGDITINVDKVKEAEKADRATNDGNGDKIDDTYLKKATVIDVIYPVGSIYMSMSATNPATLFGVGTWTRISQGRMLLGADDSTYKAGETGGEATHTLTVDEMPSHSHSGSTSWADLQGNLSNSNNDSITCSASVGTSGIFSRGKGWGHFGGQASGGDATTSLHVNASHNHSLSINNTGGGAAHNNMPPYVVCYIWQRTA